MRSCADAEWHVLLTADSGDITQTYSWRRLAAQMTTFVPISSWYQEFFLLTLATAVVIFSEFLGKRLLLQPIFSGFQTRECEMGTYPDPQNNL